MREEAVNRLLNSKSFLQLEDIKTRYELGIYTSTVAVMEYFLTKFNKNDKNKYKNANYFAKVSTIAEKLGMNIKTCQYAIDELIKLNKLVRGGHVGQRQRFWAICIDGVDYSMFFNTGEVSNYNTGEVSNYNESNTGEVSNPTTVNSSTRSKDLFYVKENTDTGKKYTTVIKQERCLKDKLDLKSIDIKDERSLVLLYYSILYNQGFVERSKFASIDKEYKFNNITINWDIRSAKDLLDYFGRNEKGYSAIKNYINDYYLTYIKDKKEINVETTYLSCFRNWIKKNSNPNMKITRKKDIIATTQSNQ